MSKAEYEESQRQALIASGSLSQVQREKAELEHKSNSWQRLEQVHNLTASTTSQLQALAPLAAKVQSELASLQGTHHSAASQTNQLQQQQSEMQMQVLMQQSLFSDVMSILGTYSKSKGIKLNPTTLLTEILPAEAIEQSKILQDACTAQSIELFNAALAKIKNINFQDKEGKTILMHAIINGFYYGVDKLLQMGVNVNLVDVQGANALIYSTGLPHIKYTREIAQLTENINLKALPSISYGGNALHRLILDSNKTIFASELNGELRGTIKQNSILVLDENCDIATGWSGRALGPCSITLFLTGEDVNINGLSIGGSASSSSTIAKHEKTLKLASFLIERNIDVNALDQKGQTPLLLSVGLKLFDVTRLLVDCNARDIPSSIGNTALWVASSNGELEVVKILATLGGLNIICPTDKGMPPLHVAMRNKQILVAKELLIRGADVNVVDGGGWIALHWAATLTETNIAQSILDKGTNLNARNNMGATPLYTAVSMNNKPMTQLLIDNKANANIPGNDGFFPWHQASLDGFLEIMQMLVPKVPNIDYKTANIDQYTALWLAAQEGHLETVKWLISNNADVNAARESDGRTALQAAICGNKLPVIQELVEHGASVDKIDHGHYTPIYYAVQLEDLKTIKFLLAHNANFTLTTSKGGDQPIHMASFLCNVIIMKILLERGVSVDVTNKSGNTPLHEVLLEENKAESSKKIAAVKYLMAKSAKVDIKNAKEETALDLADHHFKEALPWLTHPETLPPLAELEASLIGNFSYVDI